MYIWQIRNGYISACRATVRKPGVTGWAQVNGYRGETDELWKMEKRVDYDMDYIENWSFWWDLKITFLTTFGRRTYRNAG
jgi:putative colanic acid biosynthesis UDP-glucose lipid carrier transferase